MRSHSHFERLPFPPPKTRRRSSRAKLAVRPRPESSSSVSKPKIVRFVPANTAPSGLTTVEKAGAAAQGVAKGLAAGLGTELAIGFAVGATGVAASTIIWMLLPFPIYAIATHWGKITARASRLCAGKGTPHDYKAAGELVSGLLLISAAGSGTDVLKESGPAVEALCRDESQE
jgi:hypothetical protein